jgi:hypothetical protein
LFPELKGGVIGGEDDEREEWVVAATVGATLHSPFALLLLVPSSLLASSWGRKILRARRWCDWRRR